MKKNLVKIIVYIFFALVLTLFLVPGCTKSSIVYNDISKSIESDKSIDFSNWQEVLAAAKGTTVNFYGWGGSELVNNWIDEELSPYVKKNYDVNVNRVPMNIDEILNLMLLDKENKNKNSPIDLIWINGENFASAKEKGLLYGPFVDFLPNFNKYIDKNDDEIKYDFGTLVDGYESPYSKAQLVLIYDTEKVDNPPKSADALLTYCKNHEGRFTYEAPPGFTGSAFVRNLIYEKVGYEKLAYLNKETTKEEIKTIIEPAIEYMRELNKYLWQKGETFPPTNEQAESMFMDGILDFAISYDPYHVSSMIENGQYKDSVRSFVFDNGTIGNTNYVAIGAHSGNIPGALVLANAILSVEMQSSKMSPKIWGTIPVLDNKKLSNEEKKVFENVDIGIGSIDQETLLSKRKPELPAYLVTIIEDIWNEEVAGE